MIHEYTRRQGSATSATHRGTRSCAGLLVALVAAHGLSAPVGAAPTALRAPRTVAAPQAQPPYTLSVTSKDGFIDVAVTAEGARLSAIAADLSKRLGARVVLGPTLQNETITVIVPESPLEPALTALAPRVLVDYEVRQDARPAPQAIYLLGVTDADPPLNTVARGMSQGLLITGNTEDSTTSSTEDPLTVIGDKRSLTITSRKQPLSDVVMAITDVLGIPVDLKGNATELVDMDIRGVLAEEAIPRISPNVRLHVRVDLNRLERTLLRLVVASPAAK